MGAITQPTFGLFGDAGRRRTVIIAGGAAFATSLLLASVASSFATLLVALTLFGTASGAFVSLSQAALMDSDTRGHEQNMARWVVAGSVGVVLGPLAMVAFVRAGLGWRGAFLGLAIATLPFVILAGRVRIGESFGTSFREALRRAVGAARDVKVLRWLIALQLTDLLGDVFLGYVALYFVDVARTDPAIAAMAVVVWGLAGLLGDLPLLGILRRVRGGSWLRASAAVAAVAYPCFLAVPWVIPKLILVGVLALVRAGWYAIPQAGLFDEMPGASGAAIALADLSGLLGSSLLPLGVGLLAAHVGLGAAMWTLLAAPITILALIP